MPQRPSPDESAPSSLYAKPESGEPRPSQLEGKEVGEYAPEIHQDLVEKYKVFENSLHPNLGVIYHPCNATDVSPSAAFPDSRVIYAELDRNAVGALRKAGYESHYGSAADGIPGHPEIPVYKPDAPVDLLILLNPQISSDIPSQYVVGGGYVLANDYHDNATELKDNPAFQLIGIIRNDPQTKQLVLDTDAPEDYWKEVETEEEFKGAPFSWGGVYYETAEQIVKLLTGKTDDILGEYKKIIEQAREQERQAQQERWNNRGEGFRQHLEGLKEFGADTASMTGEEVEGARRQYEGMLREDMASLERQTEFIVNSQGRTIVIETGLPRKKGVADDFFVFRKRFEEP